MIGQVINGDEFLALGRNDAGHVFLQFVFVLGLDEVLASLNGENGVNVDLSIGVGHDSDWVGVLGG